MVGHGESSAGSYLADPTSPIPSHCASIVVTSTVRVINTAVFLKLQSMVSIERYYFLRSSLEMYTCILKNHSFCFPVKFSGLDSVHFTFRVLKLTQIHCYHWPLQGNIKRPNITLYISSFLLGTHDQWIRQRLWCVSAGIIACYIYHDSEAP